MPRQALSDIAMQKSRALAACVAIAGSLFIASCANYPAGQIWTHFDETTLHSKKTWHTVGFRFGSLHPIVQVRIGDRNFRFLFDTGAPSTISKRVAQQLGVATIGNYNLVDSQGAIARAPFGVLSSLHLGDAEFRNIGVFITDLAPKNTSFSCLGLDGIIGYTMMPRVRSWIIDYGRQTIRFGGAPIALAGAYKVPFSYRRGQGPILNMNFGRNPKNVPIVLDTGSDGSFSYRSELLSNLARFGRTHGPIISFKSKSQTGLFGKGSAVTTGRVAQVRNFSLGPLRVRSAVFSFQHGLSLLGNDFLRHYKIGIDWDTQTVYMAPRNKAATHLNLAPRYAMHGVAINLVGNRFLVTGKADKISGSLSQLKIGDEVVRMNGIDITNRQRQRFCASVLSKSSDSAVEPLELTLRRGGRLQQVNLPVIAPYR